MESRRLTFYQQLNRYNRKINSAILSLDSLQEDYNDVFTPSSNINSSLEINELILHYFNNKDYFISFMIDIIINENVLQGNLNKKRLSFYLRRIDNKYCEQFSRRYDIPLDKVQKASSYVTNLTTYLVKRKIDYNLIRLKEVLNNVN